MDAEVLAAEDLAKFREWHRPNGPWGCKRDGSTWPCEAIRLLDHVDALTAALASEREHSRRLVERWRGRVETQERQYAALEAERDAERERADKAERDHKALVIESGRDIASLSKKFAASEVTRDRLAAVIAAARELMKFPAPAEPVDERHDRAWLALMDALDTFDADPRPAPGGE